eukprot:6625129-Pyramimonas_sp.AAC.1
MLCGYFAQHRIFKLAKRCRQPRLDEDRSSAGTTALRRLRRGLHPKEELSVTCAEHEAPLTLQEANSYEQAVRPV